MTLADVAVSGCAALSRDTTLFVVSGVETASFDLAGVASDVHQFKLYQPPDRASPSIIVRRGTVVDGIQAIDIGADARLVAVRLELSTLLTSAITPFGEKQRLEIARFVAAAVAELGPGADGAALADSLRELRELLCPLRPTSDSDDEPLVVRRVVGLDEMTYLLELRSNGELSGEVALRSPEGFETVVGDLTIRSDRTEVVALGMARMPAGSTATQGWEVVRPVSGRSIGAPPVEREPGRIRDWLAGSLVQAGAGVYPLAEASLAILAARTDRLMPTAVAHGTPPPVPVVTVVVPVADRLEAVEHQLAQLAPDPVMHRCDLLFVLTRCPDREAWSRHLDDVSALYDVPFRSTWCDGGAAAAARAGIKLARADAVVLLRLGVMLPTGSLATLAAVGPVSSVVTDGRPASYLLGRRPIVPPTAVEDLLLTDDGLFRQWLRHGAGLLPGQAPALDAPFGEAAAGIEHAARYDEWLLQSHDRTHISTAPEEVS